MVKNNFPRFVPELGKCFQYDSEGIRLTLVTTNVPTLIAQYIYAG
ncbi:MAG: hypothetical protein ONB05_12410 [candidate division KSB1 bacterium]|nr:hypothetical protein [candidate division KSB1 bacterium]